MTEIEAIARDAEHRLPRLRALARTLWPHRDDAEVMSELVVVMGQIRSARQALTRGGERP
jgi:hypothetical protein